MPPALAEFFKAHETRHKKALLERMRYRFRATRGRLAARPRYPNLSELAPRSSGGFTVRSGPQPPFIKCDLDFPLNLTNIADSYVGIGFEYGSQETPLLGPQRGDLRLWSVQTAAERGEISLAAHVEPPDFPPQEIGIFLGANGTHVSGTLGQLFYNPDMGKMKVNFLRASARVVQQEMATLASAWSISNAGMKYGVGVYGIATISLYQGLSLIGPAPSVSYWKEFFKLESPPGGPALSLLDKGYLDLNAVMPYIPNTTVLAVLVTFDVICAIQEDAVLSDDVLLLAWCNCRFAGTADKQLAVIHDGGDGVVTDNDFSFRVSEARVCGTARDQP